MTAIMVDMDQTLIEAVPNDDPRYGSAWGEVVSYKDDDGSINSYRVHIRPGAFDMVREIVNSGHRYIVWSAGTYNYVHAMMAYFSSQSKVYPERIYTRDDMVHQKGRLYKSMRSIGFEDFIVIDDNEQLIIPSERDRIIRIESWSMENHQDRDLHWVSSLMQIYGKKIPVVIKPKATRFRMTDLE